jgi:hypothetical protein
MPANMKKAPRADLERDLHDERRRQLTALREKSAS